MKNYTRNCKITRVLHKDAKSEKPKFFFKRRAYVDKMFNMRYNLFDTYAENKLDYLKTLSLVFTGKCKDIWEAYSLTH